MNLLETIDTYLLLLINRTLHVSALDPLMVFITNRAYIIVLPVMAFMIFRDKRSTFVAMAVGLASLVLADWLSSVIKHIVERPRPFQVIEGLNVLVGRGRSFSMPSNHATNAFAFIVPFYIFSKDKLRHLMLAVALAVAYSRIYVGVHYPSDVLLGAVLGSGVALLLSVFYIVLSKRDKHEAFLIGFLFTLSLFRVYYITSGVINLSPDEAHYWEWSRRLDISYYSKGPVIAYLIWTGTRLFGNTEFGVRGFAVLFSLLSSGLLYFLGKRLFDRKVGIYAASVFQVVPIFAAFGVGMSIDSPFLFFWTLSLLLFHIAVNEHSFSKWLLLGFSLGLGLMTKYTMAFFHLSAFFYLLALRDKRRLLLSPGPYISALISLIVFSPVIIWNRAQGWVTFRHTLGQSHLAEGVVFSAKSFFEFIGSQFGIITPVLFVLVIYALIKVRRQEPFLFWFSAPMLVFFLLKSAQGKVQANWPMTAYVTGVIAFSAVFLKDFTSFSRAKKTLVASALSLSLLFTAVGHYPFMFGIPTKMDPSLKLRGWKSLGAKVSELRTGIKERHFIFSDSYQVASELAFYTEGNPTTYCANFGRRMNQYDLWPGFYGLVGYDAIFVKIGNHELPSELAAAFDSYEKILFEAKDKRGRKVRDFSIFILKGFKGMEKNEPKTF